MSLEYSRLIGNIKLAAVEAVAAGKPMALIYGQVVSAAPLSIMVDQKLTLGAAQLILTRAVKEHTVYMTSAHETQAALESTDLAHTHACTDGTTQSGGAQSIAHKHLYAGTTPYTVHNGLKVGEKVLMLRADGGQKFIVLDRVEVAL